MKSGRGFLFFIYLIVGLYLINIGFNFFTLPDFTEGLDKWVLAVGAALIIISGFRFLRSYPTY